tara:strand:+ start:60 stop:440 length:381 start_codon:yes stop_codon:yes gene_type:complete
MPKVAIYRNLQKNCLSVQSRERVDYGKVIAYCKSIFVKRPKFIVREKGRLKVLEEGRKNVHAFIVGECPSLKLWSWLKDIKMGGNSTTKVFYNPYKYSTFVDKDGNPVHKARAVVVNTNYIQADLN